MATAGARGQGPGTGYNNDNNHGNGRGEGRNGRRGEREQERGSNGLSSKDNDNGNGESADYADYADSDNSSNNDGNGIRIRLVRQREQPRLDSSPPRTTVLLPTRGRGFGMTTTVTAERTPPCYHGGSFGSGVGGGGDSDNDFGCAGDRTATTYRSRRRLTALWPIFGNFRSMPEQLPVAGSRCHCILRCWHVAESCVCRDRASVD